MTNTFISTMQGWFNIRKPRSLTTKKEKAPDHLNSFKRSRWQNSKPMYDFFKNFSKLGREWNNLNLYSAPMKNLQLKPYLRANGMFCPHNPKVRQGYSCHYLHQYTYEVSSSSIRQEKENEGRTCWKGRSKTVQRRHNHVQQEKKKTTLRSLPDSQKLLVMT